MLDWNMGGFDNIRCQKSSGEYWSKTFREQKRSRRKKARLYEMMVETRRDALGFEQFFPGRQAAATDFAGLWGRGLAHRELQKDIISVSMRTRSGCLCKFDQNYV